MSSQALNSIDLYKGNDPTTIKMALKFQRSNVVNELMEYFNAPNIDELAIKLSMHY